MKKISVLGAVKNKATAFFVAFASMFFIQPTYAATASWNVTEIVKVITDGATIITSIGTAILGVIVLIFGFKMARRMIGA